MVRYLHLVLLSLFFIACSDNDKKPSTGNNGEELNNADFTNSFRKVSLPYHLTDTGLLANKDTMSIQYNTFETYIPDSLSKLLFKKPEKIKYIPLVRIEEKGKEKYFLVKAVSGNQKATLIIAFDKKNNYAATFPFLVPDSDPKTTQTSTIDKAYSISRNLSRRVSDDEVIDGKDVYAYNPESKSFILIMTDLLDDGSGELLNPIDTFKKTHPFAADYFRGEKNIVSIRDGRAENEILFFIHFENKDKKCKGELKGKAVFTSPKSAVYREGGDPCVLELHFASSSVTIKEVEGCGSQRGLDCKFDATFTKKKLPATKAANKKTKKK